MSKYTNEIEKRRTFAIISHPDAGKTTLTERILYYTGVNYKIGDTHEGTATMDWMEEQSILPEVLKVRQQPAMQCQTGWRSKKREVFPLLPLFCSFIMMVTALIFWIHRDIRISRRILTVH